MFLCESHTFAYISHFYLQRLEQAIFSVFFFPLAEMLQLLALPVVVIVCVILHCV